MQLRPEFYHAYPVQRIEKDKITLEGGIFFTCEDSEFDARSVPLGMILAKTIYSEDSVQLVLGVQQVDGGLAHEWRVKLKYGKFRITDTRSGLSELFEGKSRVTEFPSIPPEREADGPDEEWYRNQEIKKSSEQKRTSRLGRLGRRQNRNPQ